MAVASFEKVVRQQFAGGSVDIPAKATTIIRKIAVIDLIEGCSIYGLPVSADYRAIPLKVNPLRGLRWFRTWGSGGRGNRRPCRRG